MAKVKSFRSLGLQQTYDVEVEHPDHQFFLKNGMLTSNSHAISYALDSYFCAWLMHYFEPEWLCAYMETQSTQPEKRAKAISELMALGYEITKVDINHATKEWTIIPGKKFMPSFLSVKGLGNAAIDEIMLNRPYKTIYDLLWKNDGGWKHSKLNKRALDSLIRIGAFDSMDLVGEDKPFSSYRHMHHVIVENIDAIKHKKKGRDAFEELCITTRNIEPWSRDERVRMSKEIVGTFELNLIISQEVRRRLSDRHAIRSIDSLNAYGLDNEDIDDEDGSRERSDVCWFILERFEKRKTKTGKDYLMLHVSGEAGNTYKLYCWSWNAEKDKTPSVNTAYIARLNRTEFGFSTNYGQLKSLKRNLNADGT